MRKVWDTLFGLDGKKAAFPTGIPPTKLPRPRQPHRSGHDSSGLPANAGSGGSGGIALPPALPVRFGEPER